VELITTSSTAEIKKKPIFIDESGIEDRIAH
jgi:hypothetical protein